MRRFVSLVLMTMAMAVATVSPAVADPPDTHEILDQRPSGFWTSNRPATNGAYRWRLLGIGVAIAAVTGALTWRLIRKTNASRTPAEK